ncbi:MAG: hypothetical protein Q9217_000343 [Psora testacea]
MRASASPSLDSPADEWEDLCRDAGGWEYIDGSIDPPREGGQNVMVPTNEFGEKVGLARLEEALEANEWGDGGVEAMEDGEGFGNALALEEDLDGLEGINACEDHEALKEGLLKGGPMKGKGGQMEDGDQGDVCDEDVLALESMMLKMQAVRDMGAEMPDAVRKTFAVKAVREVMKTL